MITVPAGMVNLPPSLIMYDPVRLYALEASSVLASESSPSKFSEVLAFVSPSPSDGSESGQVTPVDPPQSIPVSFPF